MESRIAGLWRAGVGMSGELLVRGPCLQAARASTALDDVERSSVLSFLDGTQNPFGDYSAQSGEARRAARRSCERARPVLGWCWSGLSSLSRRALEASGGPVRSGSCCSCPP